MINREETALSGLQEKKIRALANKLESITREAQSLGVSLFGGTGSVSIRYEDDVCRRQGAEGKLLILASIPGRCWDGGCGAESPDEEGFIRGE